jgi:hypothetical protein
VVEGARLESESPEQCQATSTQLIAYALSDLAAQNDHSVCVAIARYSSRFRGARITFLSQFTFHLEPRTQS